MSSRPDPIDDAVTWFARAQSGRMTAHEQTAMEARLLAEPESREAFETLTALWAEIEPARRNPEIMAVRERARRSIRRRVFMRYAGPAMAAGLVAAVVTGLFYFAPGQAISYETRVGQASTFMLTDGSKVVLDTNSAVRTWPRLRGERRIELQRGRAHFEVAKDASRPFVVHTSSGSVTAVGTKFDVSMQQDGMKVVLLEGHVRVQPATANSQAMLMHAGQQIVGVNGAWRVASSDSAVESSWLRGKLVVEEQTLAYVVQELNRYTVRKIRIADPALGNRRISAVLDTADSASLLKAIQELNLARIHQDSDGITLENP